MVSTSVGFPLLLLLRSLFVSNEGGTRVVSVLYRCGLEYVVVVVVVATVCSVGRRLKD